MKYLMCGVAALSILGCAGSARAQDAIWSGGYVGVQAGGTTHDESAGETIRFDTNLDGRYGDVVRTVPGADAFSPGFCGGAANTPVPAGGCNSDDNGFEFGARAGYDWQFGALVLGVVGEATKTNVRDAVSAYSTTPAYYTMQRKLDSLIAIRARAGYGFGPNLLYVTGGAARGEIQHKFFTSNTANTFTQRSDSNANGYQLGGGVERQLNKDLSLGLEYIYTQLDDGGHVVRAQGPVPAANPFILVNAAGTDFRRAEEDFKTHSVRVTASYRF